MTKIDRPTRLIAYDTDENIKRRTRGEAPVYKLVRSRTILYVVVIAIVGSLMVYKLTTRQHIGLSVLHVRAPMYTLAHDGMVRNGYTLRFANKWSEPRAFALSVERRPWRDGQERGGRHAARRAAEGQPRSRRDAGGAALCHRAGRLRPRAPARRSR